MKRKVLLLLLLFVVFPVYAIDTPFTFRGARPAAMGEAFTAVADDDNAITYNPGGLVDAKKVISVFGSLFTYDFGGPDGDENYFSGSVGANVTLGYFGFQVNYVKFGDRLFYNTHGIDYMEDTYIITSAFSYKFDDKISAGGAANVFGKGGKHSGGRCF